MKRPSRLLFAIGLLLAVAPPAGATFHIMVIDEVFFGLEEAPAAQYVTLRLQAPVQTIVFGQPVDTSDSSGTAGTFAAFCSTPRSQCNLPVVSPACRDGGCPNAFEADGHQILVATPWAQGLFCVTADLLASAALPYPNGRVCFGECHLPDCPPGPVDCVAYGEFTGDNGVFGEPAPSPALGSTLAGRSERVNQFVSGGNLLDSASGFEIGTPVPTNFHDDVGSIDGVAGDADGNGTVDAGDVAGVTDAPFAGGTRCSLPAPQRGADVNFDTRVGAADIIGVVQRATVL